MAFGLSAVEHGLINTQTVSIGFPPQVLAAPAHCFYLSGAQGSEKLRALVSPCESMDPTAPRSKLWGHLTALRLRGAIFSAVSFFDLAAIGSAMLRSMNRLAVLSDKRAQASEASGA